MLLTSIALACALAQDNNTVSVIYLGVPSTANSTVRLMTHDAKTTLNKTDATTDSVSYLKNLSDKPASITVSIPIEGENVGWGMPNQIMVQVLVDDQPVSITKTTPKEVVTTDAHKKASGIVDDSYSAAYTFQMNFIGHSAHSLKVKSTTPLGHGGLDGALRIFGYSTTGCSSWDGSVGQLNVSIRYTTRNVFQIYQTFPQGKWQTGATGSFYKQLDFAPAGSSRALFIYYPGGYDKVGTGVGK
jgi:hypothetical protein